MKTLMLLLLAAGSMSLMAARTDRFLLISNPDNVKTEHYPLIMIAEALNVPKDSASHRINQVIIENMLEATPAFTTIPSDQNQSPLDLSATSTEEFKRLLDQSGADFVVLLNEYELIWKDEPFPALFHNIKYRVYNEDQMLIKEGSQFYSTYDLVNEQELKKASRKCSKKIANNILKYVL